MVVLWKAASIVVITVILRAAIDKTERDIAIVLTVVACCIVCCAALYTLSDVIVFLWSLSNISEHLGTFTEMILKIAGVAVITEITALISVDAGCSTLEKAMYLLGNALILLLALPLFESFLDVVQEILRIA